MTLLDNRNFTLLYFTELSFSHKYKMYLLPFSCFFYTLRPLLLRGCFSSNDGKIQKSSAVALSTFQFSLFGLRSLITAAMVVMVLLVLNVNPF